jgi:ERCC4-type nuclease
VSFKIVVDTREQWPLRPWRFARKGDEPTRVGEWIGDEWFPMPVDQQGARYYFETIERKLFVGDYSIDGPLEHTIMLERKSTQDLYGTVTAGRERFAAELLRAVKANMVDPKAYARRYVVIEGSWTQLSDWIGRNGRRVPLSTINANITALSIDYGVDFVWCEKYGRVEAEWFIGFVLDRVWQQANDAKVAAKAAERELVLPWAKAVGA